MTRSFSAFDEDIIAIAEDELSEQRLLQMLDRVRMRKELEQLDVQVRRQLKRIIEALLFATHEPLSFNKIREVADTLYEVKPKILLGIIQELKDEYQSQERAFLLEEVGNRFVLRVHDSYGQYVENLYRNKRTERLSSAATEVLAIVAYRQPVTRGQIDAVRGVDSSGTLAALQERGLVEVTGRLDAPGRPSLYCVTAEFMKHFGYKDLSELPKLESDEELRAAATRPSPSSNEQPQASQADAGTHEVIEESADPDSRKNLSELEERHSEHELGSHETASPEALADEKSASEPVETPSFAEAAEESNSGEPSEDLRELNALRSGEAAPQEAPTDEEQALSSEWAPANPEGEEASRTFEHNQDGNANRELGESEEGDKVAPAPNASATEQVEATIPELPLDFPKTTDESDAP